MENGWELGQLLGGWGFEREISGQGQMSGLASFEVVDAEWVLYAESGELRLDSGQRLHAEQRYLYKRLENGFAVYFHDTLELFQRVVLARSGGDWVARASHDCKADTYVSEYVFRGDGTLEVRHEVRGPRKDYVIRTVYRRDGASAK